MPTEIMQSKIARTGAIAPDGLLSVFDALGFLAGGTIADGRIPKLNVA